MAFPNNPARPPLATGGLTSLTNPYWIPEPEFIPRTALLPIDHHLGFSIPKPWPLPAPQMIFNGAPVPGVREMVYTQFTDQTPVGGKFPQAGSIQPSKFRREQFIHRV